MHFVDHSNQKLTSDEHETKKASFTGEGLKTTSLSLFSRPTHMKRVLSTGGSDFCGNKMLPRDGVLPNTKSSATLDFCFGKILVVCS